MAVYTDVSDQELEAFIASYDIGALTSFKGIAEGVENTNYLVHTDTDPFILTLYEKRVRADDLPYFLSLMEHLAARGITCPLPVRDREGRILRELAGRPAALISFLEGVWIRRPDIVHCTELGTALAKFHLAGLDFPMKRDNDLSLPGWRSLFEDVREAADGVIPDLHDEVAGELDFLSTQWNTDLPASVIHADLFPDNVFFLGDKLSGLIDFYFACNDMMAYDVAVCLNAWCFEPDASFNVTKARAMLQAYEQTRPLTEPELDALPLLARGAALRFLLTRTYDLLNTDANALVKTKDPREYLRKLRFHQRVESYRDYGLGSD
jgi:homoserine kinase type II